MFAWSRGSTLPKWKEDNSQYSILLGEVMFIIIVLNGSLLPAQKEQFARIYPIVITRI